LSFFPFVLVACFPLACLSDNFYLIFFELIKLLYYSILPF
jgi:hypothetical protein